MCIVSVELGSRLPAAEEPISGGARAVGAAALLVCAASASRAQLVVPPTVQRAPPWNAQRVFEQILYPRLWWDVDSLLGRPPEDAPVTPPEDLPVRIRQQPGYEPVGVRAGSWMFYPSLTAGGFYESNRFLFEHREAKRHDAGRSTGDVCADALDRHEVTVQANVWSDFYRNNPGLDQTNASIRKRARSTCNTKLRFSRISSQRRLTKASVP